MQSLEHAEQLLRVAIVEADAVVAHEIDRLAVWLRRADRDRAGVRRLRA